MFNECGNYSYCCYFVLQPLASMRENNEKKINANSIKPNIENKINQKINQHKNKLNRAKK